LLVLFPGALPLASAGVGGYGHLQSMEPVMGIMTVFLLTWESLNGKNEIPDRYTGAIQ
jgi:hypothetical protein